MSSSNAVEAAKYADLELACLCNLSLAWIKFGSMVKAEEACCRALLRWPSSAKALFRRGQARLALGRPTEAAADFRELSVLEPTNTEVTKMLHRAQEDADRHISPGLGLQPRQQQCRGVHDGDEFTSAPSRAGTSEGGTASTNNDETHAVSNTTTVHEETASLLCARVLANSGREESEIPTTATLSRYDYCSPRASGRVPNASEEADGHNRPEDGLSTESPGVSSFMVSDWLNSAAREHAEQKIHDKRERVATDEPQHVASRIMRCDNSSSAVIGEHCGGDASVPRLVSQLKARKAIQQQKPPRATPRATRTSEEESEWSSLKAEEMCNMQAYRRRYEGAHAEMPAKKTASRRVIHPRENACANKGGKKPSGDAAGGKDMAMQSSQWALLEEEERQLRDAFRAKLCIGTKKQNKKNAASRMRADILL